jgi:hypothetical protein
MVSSFYFVGADFVQTTDAKCSRQRIMLSFRRSSFGPSAIGTTGAVPAIRRGIMSVSGAIVNANVAGGFRG